MEQTEAFTLSDAEKEQTKLRATFLNNIGIGVMLIGVFTPIARIAYEGTGTANSLFWLVGSPIACFLLSLILHLGAMKILERLRT